MANDIVQKFGFYLVQLDLTTSESITEIIQEINEQIEAEIENNQEFQAPDFAQKHVFMTKMKESLELLRNSIFEIRNTIDICSCMNNLNINDTSDSEENPPDYFEYNPFCLNQQI